VVVSTPRRGVARSASQSSIPDSRKRIAPPGCLIAGSSPALVVHHVNGDPSDNRIVNLIPLCGDCHHDATFR
jgi:hypothetical protein